MSGTWWVVVLTAAEVSWILGMTVWILFERRPPTATVAWIFSLAALPLVGIPVYLLLGPRRFDRKKLHRAFARAAAREAADLHAPREADALEVPANFAALGVTATGAAGQPREDLHVHLRQRALGLSVGDSNLAVALDQLYGQRVGVVRLASGDAATGDLDQHVGVAEALGEIEGELGLSGG